MTERSIPSQHETARRAQLAVEQRLAPCVPTRPAQGDDYGLDAYVQHVLPGKPSLRTSLLFGLQVKGTEAAFENVHSEPLEVKHLVDWTTIQLPVMVAVHSVGSVATRWRFAGDIVRQLEISNPGWRTQGTASVQFHKQDDYSDEQLHQWINQQVAHHADREGGITRFHSSIRSVLLTELYHGHVFSGQRFGFSERPGGPAVGHAITGMQWEKGEVDEHSVLASRSLCGALLLFDQVFFPASLTYAAMGALGGRTFLRLVEAHRLVPVVYPSQDLAFVTGSDGVGDVYFFEADGDAVLQRELAGLAKKSGLGRKLIKAVTNASRRLTVREPTHRELAAVSKRLSVRELLGLGIARPQAQEPPWAAERLLRIGNVVKYYAAGAALGTDVVEFEPGLARIALARWGSALQFHRVYRALDVLHKVFEASALPDIGLVSERVGMDKCVAVAESAEGRAFREWFWQAASEVLADSGSLDEQVASRLERMVGHRSPLPRDLFIAMADNGSTEEGLAARPGGDQSLQRQRQFSAERFRRLILQKGIELPSSDAQCLCGSGSGFAACCGRILRRRFRLTYGSRPVVAAVQYRLRALPRSGGGSTAPSDQRG